MCGIVAILSPGRPVSPEALRRAVASLHHRGPDGQGDWFSPNHQVALGHARLSIIDLASGRQPIANEDERLHIVANGEFYDYERTQEELEREGHRLRTRSDSEIALHLYEDLGAQCVHRLRGEYAFALWDGRVQRLFAVRDRYGVKPLFYAIHAGALYMASEMKALFAAGVPARWNPEVAVFGRICPPDVTPFLGVQALPPGYYMMASADGEGVSVQLHQYWDVEYPAARDESRSTSEREFVEGFRAVLDESVRIRLRADVPVGCYLSGGLDSCAVIGLAARHRSDPIRAFTLRFDHADYDEGPIAEEMARKCGADFTPIPIKQDDLADNFSDAIYHAEAVFINAHSVAKFVLSRAVRDAGFKVVITGEGSDEILAGYPHFREDMLRYDNAGQDPAEIQRLLAELEKTNKVSQGLLMSKDKGRSSDLMMRLLGFIPTFLTPHLARLERMRPLYRSEYFHSHDDQDPGGLLLNSLDVKRRLGGRAPVHQALYLWAKTQLPNYVLTVLGDRMEMAHSIEGRVPFLDHEVGEYLHRTPVNMKIRGMTEKYILREAARDVLTDTVYRRRKHPFLSPPASLEPEHKKLSSLIQDTLRSRAVDSVPFLNGRKVRELADSLDGMETEQRFAIDSDLMVLMSNIFMHERLGVANS